MQKFIYTISSKGALKSLKGRSFFLELFTEHVVQCLLDEMILFPCNVIFTGGGHFYLIAPNLPQSQVIVENVRQALNNFLFEAFNGELQLFIESVSFGKKAFSDTAQVWGELAGKLEQSKRRKWASKLDELLAPPAMPNSSCLTESCQVCDREDLPLNELADDMPGVLVCKHCRDQYLIGDSLQKAARKGPSTIIIRTADAPPDTGAFQIGKSFYRILSNRDTNILEGGTETVQSVYHVNNWSMKDYRYPQSSPLLASIYIPVDRNLRDIASLVDSGFGMNRLAALRMDVDRLGRVFSSAVVQNERKFSRMAAMSRNLSLFFKYHLDGILAGKPEYPEKTRTVKQPDSEVRRVLTVYAGGDDLFLLGHWLDVTEAAWDIEKAFLAFSGNPFMTLSAGLTLGGIHEPVYRLAEWSGAAESRAKTSGRSRITLFDQYTFTWDEMEKVRLLLTVLIKFCEVQNSRLVLSNGSFSRGFLYRLLTLARKHRHAEEGQWALPKIAYLFGRFLPDKNYLAGWQILKNEIFSTRETGPAKWLQLEVAIVFLLMLMRKGDN